MANLNIQVNTVAYQDTVPNSNPQIRNFDLTYKSFGQLIGEAGSDVFIVPPQSSLPIFSGTRTTAIDGTTAFTVMIPVAGVNTYRFTATAGTSPVFRIDRLIAIDTTTVLSVTVNGPIATLSNVSGTPMDTTNIQVGDILNILPGSGASLTNEGRFIIWSVSPGSISYQNLEAVAETFTVADTTDLLVYSNGSNNEIQIGDSLLISAGFSPATWGNYIVTEVTPTWFEISIGAPNGIPLESGIIPTASGLVFFSNSKQFLMVAAQGECYVQVNGSIAKNVLLSPIEVGNPEKPALYLQQGEIYSLTIQNTGVSAVSVVVATAE